MWSLLLALGCRVPPSGPGAGELPGVLRLGPPTPAAGIYGVAAHPDGTEIYVSNLHVPFVTLIDPLTGANAGGLDLRDAGVDHPWFPVLAVTDRTLWVSAFDEELVLRFDVDTHEALDPVSPGGRPTCMVASDEGLWVGLFEGEAVLLDGEIIVERVALPGPPIALWADGGDLGWLGDDPAEAALLRDGALEWQVALDATWPFAVLAWEGRLFVTDRASGDVLVLEDGALADRVHTGSDTFSLARQGDHLLVVNRQGAALPASGSYEGGPGRITALTRDLGPVWTADLDRTVHFVAFDGSLLWTANEDALRLSAVEPSTGEEVLRGPRVGLTLDSLTPVDGDLLVPSHLTDEIWRLDPEGGARSLDTCGWPFQAVLDPDSGEAWTPCQASGDLLRFDPDTLEASVVDVADTFQSVCDDGLCTGHDLLVAATWTAEGLAWTDPHLPGVRWVDGHSLSIEATAEEAAHVWHYDLLELDGGLVVFEPRDQRLYRVEEGVVTGTAAVTGEAAGFPLVLDGERVWVAHVAWDADLNTVASLAGGTVVAAGAGWLVVQDGWDLHTVDTLTLETVATLPLDDLRVPPLPSPLGDPRPLRFRVLADGTLAVANVFGGTVERRSLPDLGALGSDEVRGAGRWAEEPGLR